MNSQNPWDYLRQGNAEPGLVILRELYTRDPSASHIMELGVAYMWDGDYQAAREHFEHAIQTYRYTMDAFYGMAGVASWCVGNYVRAVERWLSGLDAAYADAAGLGIKLPLLLFVASILKPQMFQRRRAEELLTEKSKDSRAASWPGSLARFVLGIDSNVEHILAFRAWPVSKLAEAERKRREAADKGTREWLIRFYGHILEFGRGSLSPMQFNRLMHEAANISQPEFSNEHYFLSLIWSPEFFIARHEASPTRSSSPAESFHPGDLH